MSCEVNTTREEECPLSPQQLRLLEACVRRKTTDARKLAEVLSCSPETVRTHFKLACKRLNVHNRSGAVLVTLERGWITMDEPPPE
jgi:DNA-binding CsgD family transcriptional regulator